MNNTINAVIELFEELLDEADNKMLDIIYSEKSKDIYITAPDVIITLFQKALIFHNELNDTCIQFQKLGLLNRINILPSVDWAVTLYHKDYSFCKHNWMVRKIPLTNPLKVKDGNLSRDIIYLNQLINSSHQKVELN